MRWQIKGTASALLVIKNLRKTLEKWENVQEQINVKTTVQMRTKVWKLRRMCEY